MSHSAYKKKGNYLLLAILLSITSCGDDTFKEVKANFTASQVTIIVGNQIQFTDLSDGEPSNWEWEFEGGDPRFSSDQNPLVVYASEGAYKVTLKASNSKNSDITTKEAFINAIPAAKEVKANFSASQVTIVVGNQIQFTDLSHGEPSSWEWEFEGGEPRLSSNQNPLVVYSSVGNYKVMLKASNQKNSDIEIKEAFISVLPKIGAGFVVSTLSLNQGSKASFTDNSSGNPTSWSWTFQGGTPSSSTEQNPVVTFTEYGRNSVSLTASNGVSLSTRTGTILVMPTNSLITYFPFHGNSNDLSGKDNHGIVTGASLTNDRYNKQNEAYSLDGVDDQVVFPFLQEFENLPLSISFWVNFEEPRPSILGTDNYDYYQSGIWFSIGQSAETLGKLAINFGNGGTPPGPNHRKTFVADDLLIVDKWIHVVGIVASTGSLKLYLDGNITSGSYTGVATSMAHTQHSGGIGRTWDPTSFFKGKIDDLRIYNRVLQEDEVSLLFDER